MLDARAISRRCYLNVCRVTAVLATLLITATNLQAAVMIVWLQINQAENNPITLPATPQTPLPSEEAFLPANQLDRWIDEDGTPLSQGTLQLQRPVAEFDGPPMPPHDLLDNDCVVEVESQVEQPCADEEYRQFIEALGIAPTEASYTAALQTQADAPTHDVDAEVVIEELNDEDLYEEQQSSEEVDAEDLYVDDPDGDSYDEDAGYGYENPASAYVDQSDVAADVETADNNAADEAPVETDGEYDYEGKYQDDNGYDDGYREQDYSEDFGDEDQVDQNEVTAEDNASEVVAQGDVQGLHALTLAAPVLLRTANTLDLVSQWLSGVSARITKIATPGDAHAAAKTEELLR